LPQGDDVLLLAVLIVAIGLDVLARRRGWPAGRG